MTIMLQRLSTVLLVLTLWLASGCGQIGALYLPEDSPQGAPAAASAEEPEEETAPEPIQ